MAWRCNAGIIITHLEAACKEVKTMDTTTTIAALIQQGMDTNPEATRAVLMGIQLGFSLAALEETKKAG